MRNVNVVLDIILLCVLSAFFGTMYMYYVIFLCSMRPVVLETIFGTNFL